MFWLGLAVTVLFVPGWIGATIPVGWVVLSCALPLALWREVKLTSLHWVLFAFLVYAFLSITWADGKLLAGWGLWLLSLWALAFYLGSVLESLEDIILGVTYGLYVSVAVAFAQALGFTPVLAWASIGHPGLFYNPMIFGEVLALIIVALGALRLWPLAIPLIPGLYLAHSRGAIAALAFGLLANWFRRPLLLLALTACGFAYLTYHPSPSDTERLQIWSAAWSQTTLFGHGPASFQFLWFRTPTGLLHPEYVHNDFLDFVFQYGVGATLLFAILACCATRRSAPEWSLFITFLFMCAFSFPFLSPVTAFLGAIAAGRLAWDWNRAWDRGPRRRYDLLHWLSLRAKGPSPSRRADVPL